LLEGAQLEQFLRKEREGRETDQLKGKGKRRGKGGGGNERKWEWRQGRQRGG